MPRRGVFLLRLPLLALAASLWGCSSTSWRQAESIVNDYRLVVEIERLTQKGEPKDAGFAHPAAISAQAFSAFFHNLRYIYPKFLSQSSLEPLVEKSLEDRFYLGLSQGLAQCMPSDRVRFAVTNMHRQFKLLPVTKMTRGVAFVQPEGVLNIAFDLVDDNPDEDREDELYYGDWEDPTRNAFSTYELKIPDGTALHRDEDGDEKHLWLTVPMAIMTTRASPAMETAPGTTEGEGPARPPAGEDAAAVPGKLTDQEGIHRLKYLRDLLERKLIDKEQFRQERERIFRQF